RDRDRVQVACDRAEARDDLTQLGPVVGRRVEAAQLRSLAGGPGRELLELRRELGVGSLRWGLDCPAQIRSPIPGAHSRGGISGLECTQTEAAGAPTTGESSRDCHSRRKTNSHLSVPVVGSLVSGHEPTDAPLRAHREEYLCLAGRYPSWRLPY